MVVRVSVEPALLAWARERSGLDDAYLTSRFPRLPEWQRRDVQPTLRQLEEYASATHTPAALLLLPEPPDEPLPIPDFRTLGNQGVSRPTGDLLDTIYICQQRQDWYRDFAQASSSDPLDFVGSLDVSTPVDDAAAALRVRVGFGLDERLAFRTWTDALRGLSEQAEALGVLVMVSGVVGSNTRRVLNAEEFRGFALVDEFAPVVFVNGTDTKAAQIFTLAHELAHVWLGEPALSNATPSTSSGNDVERWCNRVAAQMLVPLDHLRDEFSPQADLTAELDRLARRFKVSTLVVLARLRDLEHMSPEEFQRLYADELARVLALREERGSEGGNFYNTQPVRVSKRFARAVIESTIEGRTLYRDATRLLGFKKVATLDQLGQTLGVT